MKTTILASAALASGGAFAQQSVWGQCGGIGYTGTTSCVSGSGCVVQNPWYSQCLPGAPNSGPSTTTSTTTAAAPSTTLKISTTSKVGPSSTSSKPASSTTATSPPPASGKFKWLGVSESVAEFGQGTYPGVWGKDFYFPDTTTIGTLISEGYNAFRLPFAMERMAPNGLTSALSPGYLTNLTQVVNYITAHGAYAIVDPHNFGRYNGAIITDTTAFGTFWKNLASNYASNSLVVFDTNNEYHDMDQTLVLNLNQAAINAIRGTGATSQYIMAEGNSWTGAWTWNTTNDNLKALTDPQGKLIYEMHQYLDTDGSGTHPECVSGTIGVERLSGATAWLRANGKLGYLGEFSGGANSLCQTAIQGMLDYMEANSDVWLGASWWAAGPWWGTYYASFEPPSGAGYVYYDSLLKTYAP